MFIQLNLAYMENACLKAAVLRDENDQEFKKAVEQEASRISKS